MAMSMALSVSRLVFVIKIPPTQGERMKFIIF